MSGRVVNAVDETLRECKQDEQLHKSESDITLCITLLMIQNRD